MRIPEEFIALLRDRVDIVDVVSEHVRLKRSGQSYVGLCPFHSERTPSFHVTPSKGFYYCFGCGAGGTAITFLMEAEQLTFYQAVSKLAAKAGLPVPSIDEPASASAGNHRQRLLAIHELANKFYNHILMNHELGMQGLSYFSHRGLTKKIIADFQLGYAPGGGRALTDFLLRRGHAVDDLLTAGVASVNGQGEVRDRFRHRVMFPIWDLQGRTVGFGARSLGDEQPKYINTGETELFHKGKLLYGFAKARHKIRQTGQVILLEGYMDAISFHQHGIANAVAGLGTALTAEQANLLKRVAEDVILLYDGDAAGRKATMRSLEVLGEAGVLARVVELPDGVDPDEWIRERGEVGWRGLQDQAKRALSYRLTQLTHEHPDHMGSGRIDYVRDAVALIAREPSSIEREAALEWLGKTYAISVIALREDLSREMKAQQKQHHADKSGKMWNTLSRTSDATQTRPTAPQGGRMAVSERKLLTYMVLDAAVAKQVQQRLQGEFSIPIHSALQAYLYQFYIDHDKSDPELFLNLLDDPHLLNFATRLLQEASDEGVDVDKLHQEVDDCIQNLVGDGIEKTMQEMVNQLKLATERGDVEEMRRLGERIKALRQEWNRTGGRVIRLGIFQK